MTIEIWGTNENEHEMYPYFLNIYDNKVDLLKLNIIKLGVKSASIRKTLNMHIEYSF